MMEAMQGLRGLYEYDDRLLEWARLVEETTDLLDLTRNDASPHLNQNQRMLLSYQARLARQKRDWTRAEELLRMEVAWDRKQALSALAIDAAALDGSQRHRLYSLASSLNELGQVQLEQDQTKCAKAFREAIELDRRIGNNIGEAMSALNLGNSYLAISELRDLDEAEYWYKYGLQILGSANDTSRSRCIAQLGFVHWLRFVDARAKGSFANELLRYLNAARSAYHEVIELLPAGPATELAIAHGQLGLIYDAAGDLEKAMSYWIKALQHDESVGDRYGSGKIRRNIAMAWATRSRLDMALLWARASLVDFQACGSSGRDMAEHVQRLIDRIEEQQRQASSSPGYG
jgi:tetratricopeptide (TPR) repeat protein